MSTIAEGFRSFHLYSDLLPELRMMVIDEMGADDRCRFTRCSKSLRFEAMSSKKYIWELRIRFTPDRKVLLYVTYSKINMGYFYIIEEEGAKKFIKYIINDRTVRFDLHKRNNEAWRVELDPATNISQFGVYCFNKLLAFYQDSIKKLTVLGDSDDLNQLEITSLKNLKELRVYGGYLALWILSKTSRPLKILDICEAPSSFGLNTEQPIYQVRDFLNCHCLKLNNDQFLQLLASKIEIHIGYLTVNNIYNFVKFWRDGTIRRKMTKYSWFIGSSRFDVRELFRRFGIYQNNEVMIKHNIDDGKSAKLSFRSNILYLHFYDTA